MTVSDSSHVNVLCEFLLGPLDRRDPHVTADEALKALASLAESANKRLMAGFSGGIVVARKTKVEQLAEAIEAAGLHR